MKYNRILNIFFISVLVGTYINASGFHYTDKNVFGMLIFPAQSSYRCASFLMSFADFSFVYTICSVIFCVDQFISPEYYKKLLEYKYFNENLNVMFCIPIINLPFMLTVLTCDFNKELEGKDLILGVVLFILYFISLIGVVLKFMYNH